MSYDGGKPMVLVACEFSGVVRDAFTAVGCDARSCDLRESLTDGIHYQCDVREVLSMPWDIIIAHPPCTYLCNSGVRWLFGGKGERPDGKRWELMHKAAGFFRMFLNHRCRRIAVENPIMHGYARELIGRRPDQYIQPWQFGHGEVKATGLWLKGLKPLLPTEVVSGRRPRVHFESPGPDREKNRSITYAGIAKAMAEQWAYLPEKAG